MDVGISSVGGVLRWGFGGFRVLREREREIYTYKGC